MGKLSLVIIVNDSNDKNSVHRPVLGNHVKASPLHTGFVFSVNAPFAIVLETVCKYINPFVYTVFITKGGVIQGVKGLSQLAPSCEV